MRGNSEVRHVDLVKLAGLVGTGFRSIGTPLKGPETIASGFLDLHRLRPGLLVHASDTRHGRPLVTELVKHPGSTVSIVLRGRWRGRLGSRALTCGDDGPAASMFSLAEPERWMKQSAPGDHARMVNIMFSPEWLEADGLDGSSAENEALLRLSRSHLRFDRWRPSPRLAAMAERMLVQRALGAPLQRLRAESRSIEMVAEVLGWLTGGASNGSRAGILPSDAARMRRVRDFIEDSSGDVASLAALAREAGVGVRTLQRKFRVAYGCSPLEYIRRRRLERAFDLLQREGVSVTQAAHTAGYADATNFATAFKRQFGLQPRLVRSRVF